MKNFCPAFYKKLVAEGIHRNSVNKLHYFRGIVPAFSHLDEPSLSPLFTYIEIERLKKEAMKLGEKRGFNTGQKIGMEIGRKEGRKEGKKIGMEKGLEKGIIKVAKEMKKNGVDLDQIKKFTHLSKKAIEEL